MPQAIRLIDLQWGLVCVRFRYKHPERYRVMMRGEWLAWRRFLFFGKSADVRKWSAVRWLWVLNLIFCRGMEEVASFRRRRPCVMVAVMASGWCERQMQSPVTCQLIPIKSSVAVPSPAPLAYNSLISSGDDGKKNSNIPIKGRYLLVCSLSCAVFLRLVSHVDLSTVYKLNDPPSGWWCLLSDVGGLIRFGDCAAQQ